MLEFIEKKRRGEELIAREIDEIITGFTKGEVPNYQMTALLMAIYFRGLSDEETTALTEALLASGDRWDFPESFHPVLDKHSTGGVGDKTSLLMVPMLAAAGYKVPKMSGRSLAHTGGTIDKLESIPGFRAELTRAEALRQLNEVGCVIMSQSEGLVPAEKKLYALRDVTGTVPPPGLIISSILSKKLASGATHIIIDVKHGKGAFFGSENEARAFSERLVSVSRSFQPKVAAAITAMDQPLGSAVGNALEVAEVIRIAEGREAESEVARLCVGLAGALLKLAGEVENREQGEDILAETIASGGARDKLQAFIHAQGGDVDALNRRMDKLESKTRVVRITAQSTGCITRLDALSIGQFCQRQGAGRAKMDEAINPWVGVVLHKKTGDAVTPGALLAKAYAKPDSDEKAVQDEVRATFSIGEHAAAPKLLSDVVYS